MKVIGNLTKDAIIRAAVSEGISVTQEIGSSVTFESATTSYPSVVYDSSNQKIVIAYRDQGNSNYGTAIVGTVSGSSISFGTPTVFESAVVAYISGAYDSNNNKVVFSFKGASDYGRSVVGTVSGTSISFGSAANFESSGIESTGTAYDANAQRIVVAYRDDSNSNRGTAAVGTVSGTSISFGTPVVFETGAAYNFAPVYDSANNKIAIGYKVSSTGKGIVGTVSGTSISFGSSVQFESGNLSYITGTYDSTNQKVVFAYKDQGNSSHGTAVVGTVSGTSISFGTPVVFNAGNSGYFSASFDSSAGRVLISYSDDSNGSKGEAVVGTVSGTSISFSDSVLFKNASADYVASAYDANQGRVVIAYRSPDNSNYGEAVVFKVGYSSATGGTIADGKPVIVNANGTVSTVSLTARDQSVTSDTRFNTTSTSFVQSAFDSTSGKIVVVYKNSDNSNYGTAVVGTASSAGITFGTPVFFESASIEYCSVAYDSSNDKVVISYTDVGNSNRGTAIVGTVSGTSISFGSAVVFDTAVSRDTYAIFDNVNNKIVIVYRNSDNNNRCHAIVGTVSGTSISFGSDVQFSDQNNYSCRAAYIGNSKFVVITMASDDTGKAHVGTVSGTSVSFGSEANVNGSDHAQAPGISYDSTADKVVVAFYNSDNDNAGAVVGTISGTSISFGSVTNFGSVTATGDNSQLAPVYDSVNNKTIVGYIDYAASNKGTIKAGTVSGTSISFGDAIVFEQGGTKYVSGVFDSSVERVVFTYEDDDNFDRGKGVVYQSSGNDSNLTTENFVGFMDGAALDGTNGEILSSCSIARNQTSLTPGQTYFVTSTGALSTTAGSPSVTAGTAISSTELIVKG